MFVGASNHLPEDEALKALFDRFLLRVRSNNVAPEQLLSVLDAGWKLQRPEGRHSATLHFDDIEELQKLIPLVDLSVVRAPYAELVQRMRHAGLAVSDRRAVKLQRLIAASALLCARMGARFSDLWVLKHIWDTEEQYEVLCSLVGGVLEREEATGCDHPRARAGEEADAEHLARDLEAIEGQLPKADATELAYLRDRLGILDSRCQWVADQQQREFLVGKVGELWEQFER